MSNRRPSRPEHVQDFLERTDPLVVQAMRKCFGIGPTKPRLTVEERAALDAYLEPRVQALALELAAQIRVRPAPYGPRKLSQRRGR